jgi:hypothetical protein
MPSSVRSNISALPTVKAPQKKENIEICFGRLRRYCCPRTSIVSIGIFIIVAFCALCSPSNKGSKSLPVTNSPLPNTISTPAPVEPNVAPRAQPDPDEHPSIGEIGYLKSAEIAASNNKALDELSHSQYIKDDIGIQNMLSEGRACQLPVGTKVQVLDFSQVFPYSISQIRVLDGDHYGEELVIESSYLSKEQPNKPVPSVGSETPTTEMLKSATDPAPDFQFPAADAELVKVIDVNTLLLRSKDVQFIVKLNDVSVVLKPAAMRMIEEYCANKKLQVWRNKELNIKPNVINGDVWAFGSCVWPSSGSMHSSAEDSLADTLLENGLAKLRVAESEENLGERAALLHAQENGRGIWKRH